MTRRLLLGVAFATLPAAAAAEVIDRSPNGFTLKVVTEVAAPPERVWSSLLRVQEWWDREHTYSGDAKNLSMDARPGGCFCEALPAGGVEHAVVVNVQRGTLLRLRGALGPLQEGGVAGTLTWQLERAGQGTRVTLTHVAGGYLAGGLDKIADPVDAVLTQQVALLKQYSERSRR